MRGVNESFCLVPDFTGEELLPKSPNRRQHHASGLAYRQQQHTATAANLDLLLQNCIDQVCFPYPNCMTQQAIGINCRHGGLLGRPDVLQVLKA